MMDCRLPQNRLSYFTALYKMNLEQRVMPGLVYLYLPELAERLDWDDEQKLWFAFLNGLTQNPITTLVLMEQLPQLPRHTLELKSFEDWFNAHWAKLQFDVDRQKNKRGTVQAIRSYAALVAGTGSQAGLYQDKAYQQCWEVACQVHSFGRLSTFSYLEYVRIMGHAPDCDDLMFSDREGSRSHRNGMLMLHGHDELVWDKRAKNGCTGAYKDFAGMCLKMSGAAAAFLDRFKEHNPGTPSVGNFTLESQLCTFKNHFYGRRYPGVYADMAWERILWAEEHGWKHYAGVFRNIREDCLPNWLRMEVQADGLSIKQRAAVFPETGLPYRAEYFL